MTNSKDKSRKYKSTKTSKKSAVKAIEPVLAKSADGTIQITFTIPWETIEANRKEAAVELGKNLDVPGFRKGKAPIEKVVEKVPADKLLQKALSKVLPKLLGEAISKHKIKPAIYPKFELLKAAENEDWQVRALTCEIPDFALGDYKKKVSGASKSQKIWTPDSAKSPTPQSYGDGAASSGKPDLSTTSSVDKPNKEIPRAEKEQQVLKILLDEIKIEIPSLLANEEVNARLSKLLEKIEKLGLDLDSYLKSIGKTSETLRSEYEKQAKDTISLELILSKIAEKEELNITDQQIDQAIEAAVHADPKSKERLETPEQRSYIKSILSRRTVLDSLISLV